MPEGDGAVQAAIDELYGAALGEFVAERKRLAAALRAEGDREGAARVARLPKPSAAAWAVNLVAREAPDAVGAWLDAALELRELTLNARAAGGDAIRAASARHRAASARVSSLVRELARPNGRAPTETVLDGVRAIMQSAGADPELAELIRAGRVVSERAAAEPGLAAPAPAPAPAARAAPAPAGETSAADESPAESRRRAEAQRRAAQERAERERLQRAIAAAQDAVSSRRAEVARRAAVAARADERLEEARRTLHRSQSEAEAARDSVADAEHSAVEAERELERLRAQLREA